MRIRIAGTVLGVMLVLGLMGSIAVNAVASGPGTQADPHVKERIVLCDGPGPQPQPDGNSLSPAVRMGTLWPVS